MGPQSNLSQSTLTSFEIETQNTTMKYAVESIWKEVILNDLLVVCEQLRAQFPPHEKLVSQNEYEKINT